MTCMHDNMEISQLRNLFRHGLPKLAMLSTQSSTYSHVSTEKPKVLITGALGNIGPYLSKALRKLYSKENVITSDWTIATQEQLAEGPHIFADATDLKTLRRAVVNNRINWLIHLSHLPRYTAEKNLPLAIKLNIKSTHNVMQVAHRFGLRLFIPSSMSAFGPDTPKRMAPDDTIQRPRSISGVAKVHLELLGNAFFHNYNLDFRCLRLCEVVSTNLPARSMSEFMPNMIYGAYKNNHYRSYLNASSRIPIVYIDDCIDGIIKFLETPSEKLTRRTYNIAAFELSPLELSNILKKVMPKFQVTYASGLRQEIFKTRPHMLDDKEARKDWNWQPKYDLNKLVNLLTKWALDKIDAEKANKPDK